MQTTVFTLLIRAVYQRGFGVLQAMMTLKGNNAAKPAQDLTAPGLKTETQIEDPDFL